MAPGPDEQHPELGVNVPDDARALESDRLAYLRELQDRAASPSPGPTPTAAEAQADGPWLPGGTARHVRRIALTFVLGWAGMALLVSGLMIAFTPRGEPDAATLALADSGRPPGTVGALLPDEVVEISGQERSLRGVRPAIIAVVPTGACSAGECEVTIQQLWRQAREYRLRMFVAGAPDDATALRALTRGPAAGAAIMTDPAGALSRFEPTGLTLVLVHADGIVGSVIRDVQPGARFEQYLRPLRTAGAGVA